MKKQKGNTLLIVLILAAAVLIGGYVLYQRGAMPSANQPEQQSNAIQNDSGLQSASNDLDSTNVDSMDTELNQTTQDASNF